MIEKQKLREWQTPLLLLTVVLYAICGWLGTYLGQLYQIPTDRPGGDPPWYFIRQDAIEGLCFLVYLVLCVAIGAWANRKQIPGGASLILFGFIWSISPVWIMGLIFLKSDNIFDPEKARTAWPTFNSYQGDPLRWGGFAILFVLVSLYLLLKRRSAPEESLNMLSSIKTETRDSSA